jgi:hypothetical protein
VNIGNLINEIRLDLEDNFGKTDLWFDVPDALGNFRPAPDRWTIYEVLEHVTLTNHFLLILIEKGAIKALKRAETESISEALAGYVFHRDKLTEVGIHQSFDWIRPAHMEPKGDKSPDEVRKLLKEQLTQCIDVLGRLKNGEGVLCTTTMTVNDLGKIDVYEYLYFVSQHAKRHLAQMERNRAAFPGK